jgi:VWFA-related protein
MTSRAIVIFLLSALLRVALVHAQAAVFRSGVDVVTVPVSVVKNDRPVLGLTSGDFVLTDDGVPQAVEVVAQGAQPLDLTLLLDASASAGGKSLTDFKDTIGDITESLLPVDRVRLVSVRGSVADLGGLQPGGLRDAVVALGAGGGTSLYNALATALIVVPRVARLHLVLVYSDGLDTTSFIGVPELGGLARHSAAVLYVGLRRGTVPHSGLMYTGGPNAAGLREAAEATGGRLVELYDERSIRSFFVRTLETARSGYLLSYSPEGVASHGWHDLAVHTRASGLTVRARKGYDN